MDYKKMLAVSAALIGTAALAVESSVVGYQNKGFDNSGYNIAGVTFLPVGQNASAVTLGDITPNEDFLTSSIQFMTSGGANANTTFKGKSVRATYTYWTEDDEPEDGAGWYLSVDGDGEINQNDLVAIPAGGGFLVNRKGSEPNATVTIPSAL